MNKPEIENLIAKLRKENEEYSDKEAYQDDFRRNLILIDALEKQLTNGWIPVSSGRLPEKSDSYTVTKKCVGEETCIYDVCNEIFWTSDKKWDCERDELCEWKVTAWKKEKPYKEVSDAERN